VVGVVGLAVYDDRIDLIMEIPLLGGVTPPAIFLQSRLTVMVAHEDVVINVIPIAINANCVVYVFAIAVLQLNDAVLVKVIDVVVHVLRLDPHRVVFVDVYVIATPRYSHDVVVDAAWTHSAVLVCTHGVALVLVVILAAVIASAVVMTTRYTAGLT
jgi:hypothetical protein